MSLSLPACLPACLFACASPNKSPADDEWVAQCVAGSRDARNRFATFSYLCGSIPPGGAWRDDRLDLFDALDVPLQVRTYLLPASQPAS